MKTQNITIQVPIWSINKARSLLDVISGEIELKINKRMKEFSYKEEFKIIVSEFYITLCGEEEEIKYLIKRIEDEFK